MRWNVKRKRSSVILGLFRLNIMEEEVRKVIAAWVLEGKNPEFHKAEKEKLYKNWPTLAKAIDDLVLRDYLIFKK